MQSALLHNSGERELLKRDSWSRKVQVQFTYIRGPNSTITIILSVRHQAQRARVPLVMYLRS